MITPEFVLSQREFDVLWQSLGLGRTPYPLDVPTEGATESERKALVQNTLAGLRERGLLHDERLEGLLALLGDHEVSVDAVAGLGRTVRALAVAAGERAALAIIDDDQVGLVTIRATALAREIVAVLPPGTPGPGNALSVRLRALEDAVKLRDDEDEDSESPWQEPKAELDEKEALRRSGMSTQDALAVSELAANRTAGGQFGVTVRQQRSEVLINWFDTPQGRYLMVNSGGWLSLSPTDNDRIAVRIGAALT
ncbi:ESX secretion-associated protein EspG [Lentzea flaviverrucosa]|uniref:EspG family protein n=1 Tax=Lentzea flaviverrucosa TaxID=200379 RepID=A0A1H9BJI4_9PSEU|nr:ESX secretion-associated protein EspG [Lentzea flaviverrucosa]RDI31758.1 ESAT-6 protein secretion system EspG family protein [Lentzea flaviverrucosa]SEP88891.1 EspG family protein [Lentzea flaviverrucosa]